MFVSFWVDFTGANVGNIVQFGSSMYIKKLRAVTWAITLAAGAPQYIQLYIPELSQHLNSYTSSSPSMIQLPLGPGAIAAGSAWSGKSVRVIKEIERPSIRMPRNFAVHLYDTGSSPIPLANVTTGFVKFEGELVERSGI